MKDEELCVWLRDNSSGVYRPCNDAAARIEALNSALNALLDVAYECDSWESFPSKALEDAEKALCA